MYIVYVDKKYVSVSTFSVLTRVDRIRKICVAKMFLSVAVSFELAVTRQIVHFLHINNVHKFK